MRHMWRRALNHRKNVALRNARAAKEVELVASTPPTTAPNVESYWFDSNVQTIPANVVDMIGSAKQIAAISQERSSKEVDQNGTPAIKIGL
jgi:hypothetical protein